MDNGAAYAEAVIPAKHSVAGITLRPMAIGHGILLQKRGSPIAGYWNDDAPSRLQLGELALAVWVCSRSATAAIKGCGSWWMRYRLKRIAKAILRHGMLSAQIEFMRYVGSGFLAPRMRVSGEAKRLGSPILAILHVTMVEHFGCNLAEALNTPISLAFWQRSIMLDEKGFAAIWTKDDYEFEEYTRALARNPEELDRLFEQPPEGEPNGQ